MKIRVFLIIILCILSGQTQLTAQIQPPIGKGLFWSQPQYDLIDQENSLADAQEPQNTAIIDTAAYIIGSHFRALFRNYERYYQYNDSIYVPTFRHDWAEMIRRRAEVQSEIYEENQQHIKFILDYFKPGTQRPESAYDSLFHYTHKYYRIENEDLFLIKEFINLLLPHYEKEVKRPERLMLCYVIAGYCDFEVSRIDHDTLTSLRSYDYYMKVIDMFEQEPTFHSRVSPFFVMCAYCNAMMSFSVRGDITMEEAYSIRRRMEVFYKKNRKFMDSLVNMPEYYEWICNLFDLKAPVISIFNGENNTELFKTLYKNYNRCRRSISQKEFEVFMNINYSDRLIDQWFIQATLGEINATKAFLDSYNRIVENLQGLEVIDFSQRNRNIQNLYNTIATSLALMEMTDFSDQQKHDYVIDYFRIIDRFLSLHPKNKLITERSDIELRILSLPAVKKYLTTEEQIYYMNEFIVYEQPQTYAHVTMVSRLCDVLLEAVINHRPELLHDVPGCGTIIDTWKNEKKLRSFMYDAGMYHDLGKNVIPIIISNNFRKLTDSEFALIRLHPELSAKFLDINPEFQKYLDLALGHHKWYNGKGGYPASFDNVSSPYRILIDILTICDCTDAATDYFGRNYRNTKKFRQVLGEFDADAGVRYNPDLVKLIHDVPSLAEKMTEIVDEKRMDSYYDIYKLYFR